MTTYSVAGKAHRALARLAEGPAPFCELSRTSESERTRNRRLKFVHLLRAMIADGLIAHDGEYILLPAGADVLACLEAGRPAHMAPSRPNCRVFVERRAAA